MSTDVLSIPGALKRSPGPVVLIVIELSVLMAVLCNVLFLVSDYARITSIPTGVNERDLAFVQRIGVVGSSGSGFDFGNFKEALRPFESVPGVAAAAYGSVPFFGGSRTPVFLTRGQRSPSATAHQFFGSQGLDRVLGVHLLAGHIPSDAELPQLDHLQPNLQAPIVVTQALAQHLFPGDRQVVGKVIFVPAEGVGVIPAQIAGIIDTLRATITGAPEDDYSYLLEAYFHDNAMGGVYVIRSRPGQAQAALEGARLALARHDRGGSVLAMSGTVRALRDQYLADTVANIWTLSAVLAVLVLVAVCGLAALTSFWVQRRRVHIGIRRALGATRGNILQYFQVENALIVGVGVCIGAVLALALNEALVRLYAVPPLPLGYLVAAGVLLLILGQLAALAPALKAAATPPSTALRATY